MKALIIIGIILSTLPCAAQRSFGHILAEIQENNSTLRAAREQIEADKIGHRTGIYLPNPEVELGYKRSIEAPNGQRMDLSIRQAFDFPTAYHYRGLLARGRCTRADLTFLLLQRDLLLEAQRLCIDLVYRNALGAELNKRLSHARLMERSVLGRFDHGDVDAIERNKAKLNALNAKTSCEANEIERQAIISQLTRLNGGQAIDLKDTAYPPRQVPTDFKAWEATLAGREFERSIRHQELTNSRTEEKLNYALSLPKITLGYVSEGIDKMRIHGPTIGLSIPLWENKNTIRAAKARTQARLADLHDATQQLNASLRAAFDKANRLKSIAAEYRQNLESTSSVALLQKALDNGQISLTEYLLELSIYYETMGNALVAERDFQYALADLYRWEL